jgi:hypothetical protein
MPILALSLLSGWPLVGLGQAVNKALIQGIRNRLRPAVAPAPQEAASAKHDLG